MRCSISVDVTSVKKDLSDSQNGRHAEQFSLGKLDQILVFRFRRLRDFIFEGFRNSLAEKGGLKTGDFTILALIDANPAISQTDLARIGGCDRAVLVGILDDLEDRGLAIRKRDRNDRRRHKLEITPAGRTVLEELCRCAIENEAIPLAALSDEETEVLRRALDKMYRHVF